MFVVAVPAASELSFALVCCRRNDWCVAGEVQHAVFGRIEQLLQLLLQHMLHFLLLPLPKLRPHLPRLFLQAAA